MHLRTFDIRHPRLQYLLDHSGQPIWTPILFTRYLIDRFQSSDVAATPPEAILLRGDSDTSVDIVSIGLRYRF
jgi:hypothetical protein